MMSRSTTALLALLLPVAAAAACAPAESEDADVSEGASTVAEDAVWSGAWTQESRDAWYKTPQGSHLIDLEVFAALEQPKAAKLFTSRSYLEAFGFLYPPNAAIEALPGIPDGLPIGVVPDRNDAKSRDDLGFTCSACHTGQVRVNGKRVLVEGGQPFFQFQPFFDALHTSLEATKASKTKLARFCKRLGGTAESCKARLDEATTRVAGIHARNPASVVDGPGRLDAISRILNELFDGQLGMEKGADAQVPVSYPQVWDVPKLQCVQTNCLAANALSRNVGEVLGVFGHATMMKKDGKLLGITSSAKVENLVKIEKSLETLPSPKWTRIMGSLDTGLVARGETVFGANCAGCHAESYKGAAAPETAFVTETGAGKTIKLWAVKTVPYQEVGTDPSFVEIHGARTVASAEINAIFDKALKEKIAKGFEAAASREATGAELEEAFQKTNQKLIASNLRAPTNTANDGRLSSILALGVVTSVIEHTFLGAREADPVKRDDLRKEWESYRSPATADVNLAVYRARPLDGIAFTAPFGHNGSWPTLRDVLTAPAKRTKRFVVRPDTIDTRNVGLDISNGGPGFVLDTTLPGNSNAGHPYGTDLAETDKQALLEYLKSI